MKYRFKPTQRFWESFYALPPDQKDSTRRAWKIFKEKSFRFSIALPQDSQIVSPLRPHDLRG